MRIRGFWKGYNQTSLLGYRGYIEKLISLVHCTSRFFPISDQIKCGSRGGGTGGPDPPPPGKSQVIRVSIGNKQLDPPGQSWTPPPLWKMLDPQKSKLFCKYCGGKLIGSVARKPYFVAREQERIPDCASAV